MCETGIIKSNMWHLKLIKQTPVLYKYSVLQIHIYKNVNINIKDSVIHSGQSVESTGRGRSSPLGLCSISNFSDQRLLQCVCRLQITIAWHCVHVWLCVYVCVYKLSVCSSSSIMCVCREWSWGTFQAGCNGCCAEPVRQDTGSLGRRAWSSGSLLPPVARRR